jgi:hypothetical protein
MLRRCWSKMETVGTWQRVYFGKRVRKYRNWFLDRKSPCGQRSEVVAAVLRSRPRSCPGSEEPGHSLIPHASASSSWVKVRPSPASDRMRLSASASPASRRKHRFSARSASSSARGIETISSVRAVMRTPHQHGGCSSPSLLAVRRLTPEPRRPTQRRRPEPVRSSAPTTSRRYRGGSRLVSIPVRWVAERVPGDRPQQERSHRPGPVCLRDVRERQSHSRGRLVAPGQERPGQDIAQLCAPGDHADGWATATSCHRPPLRLRLLPLA